MSTKGQGKNEETNRQLVNLKEASKDHGDEFRNRDGINVTIKYLNKLNSMLETYSKIEKPTLLDVCKVIVCTCPGSHGLFQ